MTTIKITSFDPLRLELPSAETIAGELSIQLPAVHYTLIDLSMDGIIPGGPHIGADLDGWRYTLELAEPTALGKLVEMIHKTADSFKELHACIQQGVDKQGPLLDRHKKAAV